MFLVIQSKQYKPPYPLLVRRSQLASLSHDSQARVIVVGTLPTLAPYTGIVILPVHRSCGGATASSSGERLSCRSILMAAFSRCCAYP